MPARWGGMDSEAQTFYPLNASHRLPDLTVLLGAHEMLQVSLKSEEKE